MSEAPTYDLPPHERDVPYTAYLVQNKLSHRRLLPKESTHTFVYSTPYLCASLTALESHALDKGNGWLFGYGGISFRVTGLRESGYLQPAAFKGQTIKQKVEILLKRRGYDVEELLDVWILTMPTYLGYEGMNPLTVYFAYKKDGSPWLVLLEIHNTFYERHVHILEVNESSAIDKKSSKGYDYHWLFPREFHVSPFNDRSGFYGISVVLPFATAPSRFSGVPPPPPRARVRVDLFTESASDSSVPGPLKLIATIDPQTSVPFTAGNLRASLARQPVVLLRAWSRILYNAWILHYVKNLDVFLRPDPRPAIPAWSPSEALASAQSAEDSNGDSDAVTHPQVRVLEKDNGAYTLSLDLSNSGKQHVAGGVGWQPESSAEAFARARVADFLVRRVQELGVEVVFVPANPAIPRRHFKPTRFIQDEKLDNADKKGGKLVVSHMSATVWTSLWASPSAEHALKVGEKEGQFVVNDRELFLQVFSAASSDSSSTSSKELTYAQRLRASQIPATSPLIALPVPSSHPIDASVSTWTYILTLYTLWTSFFFDYLTELAYGVFGARFVKGQEPWGWRVWERVGEKGSRMGEYLEGNVHEEGYIVGSVLKR